eukprot:7377776-Prymnesium_polylepis.2
MKDAARTLGESRVATHDSDSERRTSPGHPHPPPTRLTRAQTARPHSTPTMRTPCACRTPIPITAPPLHAPVSLRTRPTPRESRSRRDHLQELTAIRIGSRHTGELVAYDVRVMRGSRPVMRNRPRQIR